MWVTTLSTLITNFRKKGEEIIVWTWLPEWKEICQSRSLSTIRRGRTRAVQVDEMYLPETGWKLAHYVAISKNTGVIPS